MHRRVLCCLLGNPLLWRWATSKPISSSRALCSTRWQRDARARGAVCCVWRNNQWEEIDSSCACCRIFRECSDLQKIDLRANGKQDVTEMSMLAGLGTRGPCALLSRLMWRRAVFLTPLALGVALRLLFICGLRLSSRADYLKFMYKYSAAVDLSSRPIFSLQNSSISPATHLSTLI